MPKGIENRLKAEYPNNPHAVYGTLNKIGAMRGNKETAKGAQMEAKFERDHGSGSRELHPTMRAHGQMVKEAHQHLVKAIPGFKDLPFEQRAAATQEHVRQRRKNGHGLY